MSTTAYTLHDAHCSAQTHTGYTLAHIRARNNPKKKAACKREGQLSANQVKSGQG